MSNKPTQSKISLEPEEVLFLYKNCNASIKSVVFERLKKQGHKYNKLLITKEVSKLKREYNPIIIAEIRSVLKENLGLEFNPKNN
ncbi:MULTISPECIES: hypothetical protein [Sphingobacterium]|uniref:hypothetical protein n=1 Tax=Sphingobacterium TaxID=28453 RepID=UPI00257F78DB|nr:MULTISPECIES: hypothetical protein [Sphingobacterium]